MPGRNTIDTTTHCALITKSNGTVTTICNKYNDKYRYGYNGQMKDDDWQGNGNHLQFKFRGLDTRLGRFTSVDPLFKNYPANGSYNFAEDRVIDGMDLEGLEYATFNINVDLKSGHVTKISVTTYYDLKNKGTFGPGVQYNYIDNASGKPFITDYSVNRYGLYQGSDNPRLPTVGKSYTDRHDDYSLPPIDETDASAEQHDKDYDKAGLAGVLDKKSSAANKAYIKRADRTIDKQKKGQKDDITGKPVTKDAANAAKSGKALFKTVEDLKDGKPTEEHIEKSKYLPAQ